MILFKFSIVFAAGLVPCCYSEELGTDQCLERYTDRRMLEILTALNVKINHVNTRVFVNQFYPTFLCDLNNSWKELMDQVKTVDHSSATQMDTDRRMLEILTALHEKINHMHTTVVVNQFFSRCISILQNNDIKNSKNCWKDLMDQVKTVDNTSATQILVLGKLIDETYAGTPDCWAIIAMFIESIVEKGSEVPIGNYKLLLHAMDKFGHLYYKQTSSENDLYGRSLDYTFSTLSQIRNAEGDTSPLFTQTLPSVVKTILSEKEVYIRNNATGLYMFEGPYVQLYFDGINEYTNKYLWRIKPLHDPDTFYIVNSMENKMLTITSYHHGKTMTLAEYDRGSIDIRNFPRNSTFRIRLFEGSSGEEVAIQSEYDGLNKLGIDGYRTGKMHTIHSTPTSVWLLQPKKDDTF